MRALLLNDVRRVLTLLAGFTIGMHLGNFLHEFGHALGCWLSGGVVTAIVIYAPLPAGEVLSHASNPFATVWGGVVFGSLFTLPLLALTRILSPGSSLRFAALMAAAFCLGHNGLYLFVGSIAPYADAENMIRLGAPRWLLFLLGLPLLAGFIFVLALAIRMIDIGSDKSVWKWIIVTELGLLTVPALMVSGAVVSQFSESFKLSMVLLGVSFAICFAFAAYLARSAAGSRGADGERSLLPQSWSIPFALLAGALLLVAGEWLAFGPARPGAAPPQWEITVENRSDPTCSFFVTLGTDNSRAIKVEGVAKGERISLVAGISQTVVRTIKAVRNKDEQTLAPNLTLPVGKRYAIIVASDGKLEASISAR